MLSWALLEKELTEQANRKRTFSLRIFYVLTLFSVYSLVFFQGVNNGVLGGLGRGAHLFNTTMTVQWIAILLILPVLASNVITDERERNTLDLLIISHMGLGQIVLQKFFSRLIPMSASCWCRFPCMRFPFVRVVFSPPGGRRLYAPRLAPAYSSRPPHYFLGGGHHRFRRHDALLRLDHRCRDSACRITCVYTPRWPFSGFKSRWPSPSSLSLE